MKEGMHRKLVIICNLKRLTKSQLKQKVIDFSLCAAIIEFKAEGCDFPSLHLPPFGRL